MQRLALLALLVATLGGCALPLFANADDYGNDCADDGACGSNGICLQGMCVATQADLGDLYLLIDLPASAAFGPGSSHLVSLGQSVNVSDPNGIAVNQNVTLNELVDVQASMQVTVPISGCEEELRAFEGRVPFGLELYPSEPASGLPLLAYTTSPSQEIGKNVAAQVPAGTYDVYLRPKTFANATNNMPSACDGAIPPILLKSQKLFAGPVDISPVASDEPVELSGTIDTPNLEGWSIVVADNKTRHIVSTVDQPKTDGDLSTFSLSYWPSEESSRIIRLSPPSDAIENGVPEMLWVQSAIDLDGDNKVALKIADMLQAQAIQVTGSVLSSFGNQAVPATLSIRSDQIDGADGFHAFQRTVQTDATGKFQLLLRPGQYTLVAAPADSTEHAISTVEWTLSGNDLGNGKTILVTPKSELGARVLLPTGAPAADIPVLLESSVEDRKTLLEQALESDAPLTANTASATGPTGRFALAVDPGFFDLSVQPAGESGWPWIVRQRIGVTANDGTDPTSLGDLLLSSPVVLQGSLLSPTGRTLSNATIRVFMTQTDESTGSQAAVKIAGSKSGPNGEFQLLLPPLLAE